MKLAQRHESAPPQLMTATTERFSTRDVAQQTSELQLVAPNKKQEGELSQTDHASAYTKVFGQVWECGRS